MVAILGVEVSRGLLEAWSGWLAPDPQPFLVGPDEMWRGLKEQRGLVTPELRDTYRLYERHTIEFAENGNGSA